MPAGYIISRAIGAVNGFFHQPLRGSPPTLILHGLADATVDYEQAKELDRKLTEYGVEHQLVLLEGIGHTFDLSGWRGKPLPTGVKSIVIGFFDKYLKAK